MAKQKRPTNTCVCSQVRENQIKPLDLTEDSKKELVKLQEEKQHWQEQLEVGCSWA